jgi:hypothetical protein
VVPTGVVGVVVIISFSPLSAFRAAALMSQEWPGTVIRTVGRSVDGAADLHVRRSVDTGPAGATTTWPIPVPVTLECHWSRRAHDGRAHEPTRGAQS